MSAGAAFDVGHLRVVQCARSVGTEWPLDDDDIVVGGEAVHCTPSLTPPQAAALARGNHAYAFARFQGAIEAYTQAVVAGGDALPVALCNRSAAHFACGTPAHFHAAVEDAEAAIAAAPGLPRAHLRKALALRALNKFASAGTALALGRMLCDGSEAASFVTSAAAALGLSAEVVHAEMVGDFQIAYEELTKMVAAEGDGDHDEDEDTSAVEDDKFVALEEWLQRDTSSRFPQLVMKRYSEGYRGVHCRTDIEPDAEVMSIPRRFLISVEMGLACPLGVKLAAARIDDELSAAKHCYLSIFVLWDRR